MSLSTAGPGDLEFAFPHAVNLAELGKSSMDKKIGVYQCSRPGAGVNLISRLYVLRGTDASQSRTSTHVGEHVAQGKRSACRISRGSSIMGS